MFDTNVRIDRGYYGVAQKDKDGNEEFIRLGKAVTVERITRDIETDCVTLQLSWEYLGKKQIFEMPRCNLLEHQLLYNLADRGADITKKYFNVVVDSLRLQEQEMEAQGKRGEWIYKSLGWINIPVRTKQGAVKERLCYRAGTLLGMTKLKATYAGSLAVQPKGSFEEWKKMVDCEILGRIPAELVLLAGLSAVVKGVLSTKKVVENPIFHLAGASSTGKSAICMAATSAFGEPFDGERSLRCNDGTTKDESSIYGSWSATENALLGRYTGNQGCLIVLNEIGKYHGTDMSSLIYNFSEGTDKTRMTKDLTTRQSKGFSTTILSAGEHSIFSRCKSKADGLRLRVMELDMPMTSSAANADNIKRQSVENCGWAAPMLAQYILNHGGADMVEKLHEKKKAELLKVWPMSQYRDRFVEKFPALILATAEIAKQALGIGFHEKELQDFFLEYEESHGEARSSMASSYEMILEQTRIHMNNFIIRTESTRKFNQLDGTQVLPRNDCWGRITQCSKTLPNGQTIVQEIEIFPDIVNRLLEQNGYQDLKTCIKQWIKDGVVDFEDQAHPYRKRILFPAAGAKSGNKGAVDRVLVFRVFRDEAETTAVEEADRKAPPVSQPSQQCLKLITGEDNSDETANPA